MVNFIIIKLKKGRMTCLYFVHLLSEFVCKQQWRLKLVVGAWRSSMGTASPSVVWG